MRTACPQGHGEQDAPALRTTDGSPRGGGLGWTGVAHSGGKMTAGDRGVCDALFATDEMPPMREGLCFLLLRGENRE